jgi:ferredoxin
MVNRYHNREESLVQVENNNQNYIRHERFMGQEEPEDEMERMIDVMQQCPSPGTPTK